MVDLTDGSTHISPGNDDSAIKLAELVFPSQLKDPGKLF